MLKCHGQDVRLVLMPFFDKLNMRNYSLSIKIFSLLAEMISEALIMNSEGKIRSVVTVAF